MYKSIFAVLIAMFWSVTPSVAQEEASETDTEVQVSSGPSDPQEFETFVDGVMAGHLEAYEFPGAVISVVKDGEIFFSKGYGVSDVASGAKNDPATTLYRPGSTSKLLTWTALMQMVEQGKVDLDADVNTYLKTFKIKDGFGKPVTMRSALSHTPGFEDGGVGYLFEQSKEETLPIDEFLKLHQLERVRAPDEFSSYSNYATSLAGLVVQNVSGVDYYTYIEENILKPLNMANSTFREPLPEHLAADMATGYLHQGGVFKPQTFEFTGGIGPAGGMSASAEDMAKFMIAHLQNGRYGDVRILKEETAKQMHSLLFTHDPRLAGFAHGFYQSKFNDTTFIGHGGDTIYFHTEMKLSMEDNFGLFVSYNAPDGARARDKLIQAVMDRYYPSAEEEAPLEVHEGFKDRAAKYLGHYRGNRHNYSTSERILTGSGNSTVSMTSEGRLRVGSAQYVEVDNNLFKQVDGKGVLAFRENEAGEITHYFMEGAPMMAFYRIGTFEVLNNQLIILGIGFLFFITAIPSAIRKRKEGDQAIRSARNYAAYVSAANIGFVILMGLVLGGVDLMSLIFEIPSSIKMSLNVAYLILILTLGLVWKGYPLWKNKVGTMWERIHYSCVTLFSVILLLVLNYYNSLGDHF